MGGTTSKTEVSNLSKTISNIAMSDITQCITTSTQNQNITVVNNGFRLWTNYDIQQTSMVNTSCAQNSTLEAKLQNDIINAVSQASTSQGVAMLSAFGNTSADAQANLSNVIKNNVTMTNILSTVNTIQQSQNITSVNNYIWLFDNVSAVQGAQVFAAATLQAMDNAGVFNTIQNKLDQTSSSKSTSPLSFLSDIFGSITTTICAIVLFIFLVIIAVIYSLRKGASGATGRWESDILVQIKN